MSEIKKKPNFNLTDRRQRSKQNETKQTFSTASKGPLKRKREEQGKPGTARNQGYEKARQTRNS